jgi:hypothetical protein
MAKRSWLGRSCQSVVVVTCALWTLDHLIVVLTKLTTHTADLVEAGHHLVKVVSLALR